MALQRPNLCKAIIEPLFQQCGMCDQQSLRSACAYAQSDQSLCLSLEYSMIVKLQTEHYLEFLSFKGQARLSLHMSKYHIVGNLMSRLIYNYFICSIVIYSFFDKGKSGLYFGSKEDGEEQESIQSSIKPGEEEKCFWFYFAV